MKIFLVPLLVAVISISAFAQAPLNCTPNASVYSYYVPPAPSYYLGAQFGTGTAGCELDLSIVSGGQPPIAFVTLFVGTILPSPLIFGSPLLPCCNQAWLLGSHPIGTFHGSNPTTLIGIPVSDYTIFAGLSVSLQGLVVNGMGQLALTNAVLIDFH